jgi:hypothetical protein
LERMTGDVTTGKQLSEEKRGDRGCLSCLMMREGRS